MSEEYFIRSGDDEESRGPYNIETLLSLVDAGQVDTETLYFDEAADDWLTISSNEELKQQVFPEKKSLGLKPKGSEGFETLNVEAADAPAVSVDQMLAAAEGDTEETRYVKKAQQSREKAAKYCIPILAIIMLVSAAALLVPGVGYLMTAYNEENYMILLEKPLLLVGLFDIFVIICLALGVTDIFPLLRTRVMVGLGYFGFLYYAAWTGGDAQAVYMLGSVAAAGLGVFVCSLTQSFAILTVFGIVGLAGMGGFAYFTVMG